VFQAGGTGIYASVVPSGTASESLAVSGNGVQNANGDGIDVLSSANAPASIEV